MILSILRSLATLSLLIFAAIASADTQLPNIVLIYADDVGYGDLGCYGAKHIPTPNLDRLASGGLRFTCAYATASTCTPSRYSLLTGQYAFRNRNAVILPGNAPLLIDPQTTTLASLLKETGYSTGLVGKWHLGLGKQETPLNWNGPIAPGPKELGFEYSFHMAATGDRTPTVYIKNGRVFNLDPNDPIEVSYIDPVDNSPTGISHPHLLKTQADNQHAKTIVDGTSRIGYMSGGQSARWTDEEMPDRFLDEAINFIDNHQDKPFFLYYAMHENHVPRLPHPRFRGSTSLGVRGDAVVQLDWSVGEIIKTLEELSIAKNTLVIFTSDNGPVLFDGYYDGAIEKNGDHRPAGPWRGGKYSAWEGGTRSPFIASWPGAIKPGISEALISQVDLLASIASLCGVKLKENQGIDSEDVLDALLGKTNDARQYLIQQGVGIEAIRSGQWKYIPPGKVRNRAGVGSFPQDTIPESGALYYLPEDPQEEKNLAETYPIITQQLHSLLKTTLSGNESSTGGTDELGGAIDSP